MIAPGAEKERLDAELEQKKVVIEDPLEDDVPEIEIVTKKPEHSSTSVQYVQSRLSKKEIQADLRNMNSNQQDIFYKVRNWALQRARNQHPEPFHAFITGGAGTGKSHLIKCIYYETTRILSKIIDSPDAISVLLTAPTGTAAFNIGGQTIHSAFAISKNIKLPYIPLGESVLNTLRTKYSNIQLMIIDEISMVDHKLLTYIHGRLSQLKQSKKPFGNVSILAVGDFYQLPPVKASPLYKVKDTLFLDLWNPLFSIVTLTQVMRQREDGKFAAMLNRLRVHIRGESLLPEDKDMLNSVSCTKVPDSLKSVLHIFPTNREVSEHNDMMVDIVCNPTVISTAKDYNRSASNGQLCERDHPYSTSSPEDLLDIIKLGIGARVMLTRNIDTEDGLVNGAFGTVTAVDKTNTGEMNAVYVQFDNTACGKKLISKTISILPGSNNSVRITPIEDNLHHKNAVRKQLPLKLGWAATIHKVKGMTSKEIVVSLQNVFQPGMAYVGLSRATSLKGLHIINLDTNVIYASEEIKKSLDAMPAFIKNEQQDSLVLEKKYFNIILHNTEGILLHKDDIKKLDIFSRADVISFTETWLNRNMCIPSALLPEFEVHTAHRELSYSASHSTFRQLLTSLHSGVATFVKKRHASITATSFTEKP